MRKMFSCIVAGFLLMVGCGGGGGGGNGGGSGSSTQDLGVFETYPGGIARINWNGTELLGNTGGCYVIGTCPGYPDDPGVNFTSVGVYGDLLQAPSPDKCPASPFKIGISSVSPNEIEVSVSVGPMAADASTVSFPCDTDKTKFDRFRFGVNDNRYWVGCGKAYPRIGSGDLFANIPQDCYIDNVGPVGRALTKSLVPWGEISGPFATITRELVDGGNAKQLISYNHPNTNNLEWSFGSVKRGKTVTMRERIRVN